MFLLKSISAVAAIVVIYGLSKLLKRLFRSSSSPWRDLRGPANPSILVGHLTELIDPNNLEVVDQWIQNCGSTFKIKGPLNSDLLFTADPVAVNHILMHSSNEYHKPDGAKKILRAIAEGIIFTEGQQHAAQRRIMNPAFGPAQIRGLTEIFLAKANQLRDIWLEQTSGQKDPVRINVMSGLSLATLDAIGVAGFDYDFGSLNADNKTNELSAAIAQLLGQGQAKGRGEQDISAYTLLMLEFLPDVIKNFLLKDEKAEKHALSTMRHIGLKLIKEKKEAILSAASDAKSSRVERSDVQGRDLLSLLIKANVASDIPENLRLSDDDVLAQIPTFLLAGHETSATGTTWCLFALSNHQEVQKKLRQELFSVSTDEPSMEELNALPYLDAVVREVLRLYAPVMRLERAVWKDDIIPLSESIVDRKGQIQNSIRVRKGDRVTIPLLTINRSKAIWGEDATQFNPDRWTSPPAKAGGVPGIWGNITTFGAGPRACIGYRFAVEEIKALLFALVRGFEFEPVVPPEDIAKIGLVVQRPFLRSERERGSQLPLLIKPYHGSS